jgi:hypothetical protein
VARFEARLPTLSLVYRSGPWIAVDAFLLVLWLARSIIEGFRFAVVEFGTVQLAGSEFAHGRSPPSLLGGDKHTVERGGQANTGVAPCHVDGDVVDDKSTEAVPPVRDSNSGSERRRDCGPDVLAKRWRSPLAAGGDTQLRCVG